ncbi:MAG: SAM-dependent chlorinase/fluorinase [Proteobacteria bacterium]|nr:SAM-dependent chlorinase/fluorinase [Pseudomonadota bacterium]
MSIITLITDFGTRDGFVGAMKGVIARSTHTPVIDITHDVPRHDVAHAAWIVATACREFPKGTIHVVVVDPGVGGERTGVVVRAHDHYFIGPDNGVFAYVTEGHHEAWAIRFPRFMAPRVSPTFHGRDVFAIAARRLATGDEPNLAGPRVGLVGMLPWGVRQAGEGRVVHIDHFGNLVSDLPAGEAGTAVTVGGQTLAIASTYEDVDVGALVTYVGSAGTIEIAVREGRADHLLGVARGALVMPAREPSTLGPYR